MFSKAQRNILNKLSDSIWNVEGKWAKLYNQGHFDIVESETETEEEVTQVFVPNKASRSGKGTIYNKETALLKGLWRDTPETTKVKHRVKRKPTFDELVNTLTDLSKGVVYSKLQGNNLVNALAMDFVSKDEAVAVKLEKQDGEEYLNDYNNLVSKLSADLSAKLDTLTAKNEGIPVDALEFVSEVIFISTHREQALEVYNGNIADALALHKRDLRKQNYRLRMGFV